MSEAPAPVPTSILIVRAWLEGDPPQALRARLTTTSGTDEAERTMTAAASVEDVCAAVREWLGDFIGDGSAAVMER